MGWVRGRPLTEFGRGRPILPLPSEREKIGGPGGWCSPVSWVRGRPLTDFRRGRRNLPLPSERVKIGGPGGWCSTSAWLLDRSSHPHPSPLPQVRGRKRRLRPIGLGARKTPHRIRPGTADSASPLGEGEDWRPWREVRDFGLAASPRQPPSPQPSPSRAREEEGRLTRAFDPGPSRVVAGMGARKTPHRFPPRTAESASPPGEGEERRPWRMVLDFGLAA